MSKFTHGETRGFEWGVAPQDYNNGGIYFL
jgi:hypothetical protein